jgi:hypothetical protein
MTRLALLFALFVLASCVSARRSAFVVGSVDDPELFNLIVAALTRRPCSGETLRRAPGACELNQPSILWIRQGQLNTATIEVGIQASGNEYLAAFARTADGWREEAVWLIDE